MNGATIHDVLTGALEKWGERNFIYSRSDDVFEAKTFEDTIRDAWALAEGLLDLGLHGKNILIYGENSYEWAISDLAVMGYVGVAVAANKERKEHDLENVINIADIECVIFSNTKQAVIDEVRKKRDIKYISMQDDLPRLLDRGTLRTDVILKNDHEMCKVFFTSGTTSDSKAVMLSARNLLSGFKSLSRRVDMGPEDKGYLFLPMSHTYGGVYNFLACLYFGSELYLCSDIHRIFEELHIVKPTVFCAVPLIYERVHTMIGGDAQKAKGVFGGSIKYLFCSGAKFDPELKQFYKNAGLCVLEAYALTETASSLAVEYPGSEDLNSVGTVFEDMDVKIIDADESGHGEILVKGDTVALGYYNNEKETKKAFDEEGYFHTGDIGYVDGDCRLFLTGRKKRVIVFSNGENIYPDEIEALLMKHTGVVRAKVFERDNKLVATLFVEEDLDGVQIVEETNAKLPAYKQIYSFETIVDSVDTRMK